MPMMLHTGVPGSGKTYLMVAKMVNTFFDWSIEKQEFVRKPEHQNLTIISNIESLTLEHKDLEQLMEKRCDVLAKKKASETGITDQDVIKEYYFDFLSEKVRWFFNHEYQQRLTQVFGPIVYCIEEVQNYFDVKRFARAAWARDTCYYFEKHRHLGHTIYMDTQHNSKIAPDIRVLFETEIEAKPRTMSITGEFRYNEYSSGVKVNQLPIICKPKKNIFSCYKSMAHQETVKPKKPLVKLAVFIVVMIIGTLGCYGLVTSSLGSGVLPDEDSIAKVKAMTDSKNKKASITDQTSTLSSGSPLGSSFLQNDKEEGQWVRLDFMIYDNDTKCKILNPVTNSIQSMKEFPFHIMKSGEVFLAWIPPGFKLHNQKK